MGEPTTQVAVGGVQGTTEASLPRHGRQHDFAPHRGIESGKGVGKEEVFAMHARNIDFLDCLLTASVPRLPRPGAGCLCTTWASALELSYRLP